MAKKKCSVSAACSYHCSNVDIEAYDYIYGYGAAEELGYEKIDCKDCSSNSGKCEDCLFDGGEYCPEWERRYHE